MYRTHIVWARTWKLTLIPFLLVLADIGRSNHLTRPYGSRITRSCHGSGTGTYALWLLSMTKPGDNVVLAKVTLRVRYFYAVTLAVNVLCTRELRVILADFRR